MSRIIRHLTYRARALRRNSTAAEAKLWRLLRGRRLKAKFRRQQPLDLMIVDFCCFEALLVIEVDGPHHLRAPQNTIDRQRDALLEACGWCVLRFTNDEVLYAPDLVVKRICSALSERSPPLPSGEGEGG